jgi:hypothetical protein
MTTQFPEDPLNHIKTWQAKFKEHKQQCEVTKMDTSMDTSGTTYKDTREGLHDTSNATDAVKDWRAFCKDILDNNNPEEWIYPKDELIMAKQKAVDDFLDTICCALEELNGKEVFSCFIQAVQSQHEYTKKEYNKINELMNLLIEIK